MPKVTEYKVETDGPHFLKIVATLDDGDYGDIARQIADPLDAEIMKQALENDRRKPERGGEVWILLGDLQKQLERESVTPAARRLVKRLRELTR